MKSASEQSPPPSPAGPGAAQEETIWLLGQPHLSEYLEFVREKVRGGHEIDPRLLADEWRAANDIYYDLEKSEAGIAETVRTKPLTARCEALAEQVRADRYFRSTFDTLPVEIVMVELDKLVTSQIFVSHSFSDRLPTRAGRRPDPADLFRLCLPTAPALPPVTMRKLGGDRFQLSSPSTDFRPHKPYALDADQLASLDGHGPAAAGIALVAGFGANFLTAVRSNGRLLLQNGYHRAYAMRAAGVTFAPCIVQTVTRRDELRIAATEEVCADPAFYFAAARPPLFKDFFDARLVKRLATRPMRTVIEIEYKMRMTTVVDD